MSDFKLVPPLCMIFPACHWRVRTPGEVVTSYRPLFPFNDACWNTTWSPSLRFSASAALQGRISHHPVFSAHPAHTIHSQAPHHFRAQPSRQEGISICFFKNNATGWGHGSLEVQELFPLVINHKHDHLHKS